MKKLIVLNQLDKEVLIFSFDSNIYETAEDFLTSSEFSEEFDGPLNPEDCSYMIVDELNIQIF